MARGKAGLIDALSLVFLFTSPPIRAEVRRRDGIGGSRAPVRLSMGSQRVILSSTCSKYIQSAGSIWDETEEAIQTL
jgi:hypothetical protein